MTVKRNYDTQNSEAYGTRAAPVTLRLTSNPPTRGSTLIEYREAMHADAFLGYLELTRPASSKDNVDSGRWCDLV